MWKFIAIKITTGQADDDDNENNGLKLINRKGERKQIRQSANPK